MAAIGGREAGSAGSAAASSAARRISAQSASLPGSVEAIAEGVLTKEEAKAKMDRLRDDLQDVEQGLSRLGALPKLERQLAGEADRLARLAADFGARAKELTGPALRELLKPWIQDATFDKVTRVLAVTVRKVPAAGATPDLDWGPAVGGVQGSGAPPHRRKGILGPLPTA